METERLLIQLVAALGLTEIVHIAFEVWGARQKVQWLTRRMDSQPHGDWPLNIDSLGKTIVLHATIFAICVGLALLVLVLLSLSTHTLLQIAALELILCYAYTTLAFDAYHSEIGALIKRYKRTVKR